MKKILMLFAISAFTALSLFGADGKALAKQLRLSASSKASMQWSRVFKKKRKMIKYGIDKLNDAEKTALKTFLVNHATDSDSPEVAGM